MDTFTISKTTRAKKNCYINKNNNNNSSRREKLSDDVSVDVSWMNYKVAIKTGLCVKIYDRRFSLSIYTKIHIHFFPFFPVVVLFDFEQSWWISDVLSVRFFHTAIPFVFVHAFHDRLWPALVFSVNKTRCFRPFIHFKHAYHASVDFISRLSNWFSL